MKVKWNECTWYSKLLAAIFFIIVLSTLTFYIGTQYEATLDLHMNNSIKESSNSGTLSNPPRHIIKTATTTSTIAPPKKIPPQSNLPACPPNHKQTATPTQCACPDGAVPYENCAYIDGPLQCYYSCP